MTDSIVCPTCDTQMIQCPCCGEYMVVGNTSAPNLDSQLVTATYWIPSETQDNVDYCVVVFRDGHRTCSCKGYQHRESCKHVQYTINQLESVAL